MATGSVDQSVSVREASFDDYQQIAAIEKRTNLGNRAEGDWLRFWLENPEYKRNQHWPVGWVLENGDGQIVGSICNIPLEYELEGRRMVAATGRGWVVDPVYRTYACLLLEEFFHQEGVDLFVNTTVNQHAAPAYRTFDSPPVPQGAWDHTAFWITRYRGFARCVVAAKRWPRGPWLVLPIALGLWCRDILARKSVRGAAGLTVKREDGFDGRFDVFWEELRRQNPHLLLAVRSREALDWHFQYLLRRNRLYILTISEQDRLIAYSIFCRKDEEQLGLKRVRIVDYQALDGRATLAPMLAWMLQTCRREGIHMLEDVGCCIDQAAAPYRRKLGSWLFYYKANCTLAARLNGSASWRTSLFDGDASL
jgi:hypothetical protein